MPADVPESPVALRALVERLRERIAQLEMVIEAAPVGIGLVDADGRTPLSNATLRRLLGYSPAEFADLPFTAYTHPDDVAENDRLFTDMLAGRIDHFALEKRFVRKDGSTLWADLTVSLVRDAQGWPDYAIGMTQDITARKRLADELTAAELHYRLLVEHVPAVVYIAEPGPDGGFVYVSPRLEQMLGYSPQEWVADPSLWSDSMHPEDRATFRAHEEHLGRTADGEQFPPTTYRLRHRDGHDVWVRDDAVLHRDHEGRPRLHGVLLDVTQEKALEEQLAYMAGHDALTGLVNRARFHRTVDAALVDVRGGSGAVAVLYVDVDEFKAVNDGFGHAVGDRVLTAIAGALRDASPEGAVVARLGGDEFAVLAAGVSDADGLARRVAGAVGAIRVTAAGEPVRVTASVGAAVAHRWHTTELLLHDADQAMYRSKTGPGRGRRAGRAAGTPREGRPRGTTAYPGSAERAAPAERAQGAAPDAPAGRPGGRATSD